MTKEAGMVRASWVSLLGLLVLSLGAIATTVAVGELSDGVREIPRHWWSAFAAIVLAVGAMLTVLGVWRRYKEAA